MSIFFSVVEGIKSLAKARMAVFFSISSISLTLLLIGLFIIFNLNLQSIVGSIREKIEIEVFIDNIADDKNIAELKKNGPIYKIKAKEIIYFISPPPGLPPSRERSIASLPRWEGLREGDKMVFTLFC